MSYKAVRDYFVSRLTLKGFHELGDMEFKSDVAMKDKFILRLPEINNEGPTIVDRFHPRRMVEVHFGLKLADNKNQQADYAALHMRFDQLLKEIPNPSNFQASAFAVRNIMFDRLVESFEVTWIHFIITFIVEDELLYA